MVRHPKMRSLRSKAWPTSCLIISWQQFGEVNWVPWKTRVNGFAWPVHLWFLKASTANNPLALRKRGCTSRICQRKMRERFLCQGENGEDMSQCHNDGWNMNLDLAKKTSVTWKIILCMVTVWAVAPTEPKRTNPTLRWFSIARFNDQKRLKPRRCLRVLLVNQPVFGFLIIFGPYRNLSMLVGVRPCNITHRYVHIYPANIARGWLGYPSYSPTFLSLSLSLPPSLPPCLPPSLPPYTGQSSFSLWSTKPISDVPIYAGELFDYVLYTDSTNDCPWTSHYNPLMSSFPM